MMTTIRTGTQAIQGGGTAAPRAAAPSQNPNVTQSQNPSKEELQTAARELREAIRSNVFQEMTAARARTAAQAAVAAQGLPAPPSMPSQPREITIRGPNGQETIVGVAPHAFDNVIPPQAVDISIAFFITVAAIIIGLPLARAFARRMDRRSAPSAQLPGEIANQLAHLNQAVDAIALEVERISEGQRFTSRLLAEQREARLPTGAAER